MKIGIVGASVLDIVLTDTIPYIGVDAGVEHLVKQGIVPLKIIGDFDSISNKNIITNYSSIILPTKKNKTDLEYAIEYAIDQGYSSIKLYGVTGGRVDHFMAVLCLLKKYKTISITIYDQRNKIFLLTKGIHRIERNCYQYLSFFAIKDTIISIQGCEYNLDQYYLQIDDPLCVSNEIIDNYCTCEISQDIIVIQSNSIL